MGLHRCWLRKFVALLGNTIYYWATKVGVDYNSIMSYGSCYIHASFEKVIFEFLCLGLPIYGMEIYFSLSPKGSLTIMMRSRSFGETNMIKLQVYLTNSFKGLRGGVGDWKRFPESLYFFCFVKLKNPKLSCL